MLNLTTCVVCVILLFASVLSGCGSGSQTPITILDPNSGTVSDTDSSDQSSNDSDEDSNSADSGSDSNNGNDTGSNDTVDGDEDSNNNSNSGNPNDSSTPPFAIIATSANIGTLPLSISFDASPSLDIDGQIESFSWNFGDGTAIATGISETHIFTDTGTFTVTLTVTDDGGNSDTTTTSINVYAPSIAVSGVINLATDLQLDSDINQSSFINTSNNTLATAQMLPFPTRLAGHVNVAGEGSPGLTFTGGDDEDFFYIATNEPCSITLHNFEQLNGNLDLYVYNENQTIIGSSTGEIPSHTVNLESAGIYFIQVIALTGASNYHLSISGSSANQIATINTDSLSIADDFVPGELLIKFKADSNQINNSADENPLQANFAQAQFKHNAFPLERIGEIDQQRGLYHMGRTQLEETLNRQRLGMLPNASFNFTQEGSAPPSLHSEKAATIEFIRHLRSREDIEYASVNYIRRPLTVTPNDPQFEFQWHYDRINLPDAWEHTTGSEEVIVAVVDTGIVFEHPDLQGQTVPGYDFIADDNYSLDGDGLDADASDPGDATVESESSFHGTHVAGTIAAISDNGIGVAGIASGVKIMPLRVLGLDGGTSYDTAQAVLFAAGLANDSNTLPQQPADIINLSLGGPGYSQFEADIYQQATDAGAIIIAAAGNDGVATRYYPGAYSSVTCVSATDSRDELANYSNFGDWVDLTAPGGDLSLDQNDDGQSDGVLSTSAEKSGGTIFPIYQLSEGTSMATPHVAGVAALMESILKSNNLDLTPSDWSTAITNNEIVNDLGTEGKDNSFGYGLIDALAAVNHAEALVNSRLVTTDAITLSAEALNFGNSINSLSITVEPTSDATFISLTGSETWITVTPNLVDGDNFGTYTIAVDRSQLSAGVYNETLMLITSEGLSNIAVTAQALPESYPNISSELTVIATGTDVLTAISATTINSFLNTSEFNLNGLAGSTYYLYVGTDLDNDGVICETGEVCGAFGSVSSPTQLDARFGNQSELEITLEPSATNLPIDIPSP